MKLQDNPYLPGNDPLVRQLDNLYRQTATQVNQLSEGRLVAAYNSATAAPTTQNWALGDFVRNSAPSELGIPGAKYVIYGWINVLAGTPGTWVQARFLTGN